jgi:hypothetical protein
MSIGQTFIDQKTQKLSFLDEATFPDEMTAAILILFDILTKF